MTSAFERDVAVEFFGSTSWRIFETTLLIRCSTRALRGIMVTVNVRGTLHCSYLLLTMFPTVRERVRL